MTIDIKNLKFIITCPSCDRTFWSLKKEKQISFCPHCHVNLYPKTSTSTNKGLLPKWLAFIIASSIGIFLYASNVYINTIKNDPFTQTIIDTLVISLLVIFIFMLTLSVITQFINREMQLGVDTLAEIDADNCDYQKDQIHPYQCQECQSFRMVDMYWFRRILAKNNEPIPPLAELAKDSRFVGCLHCKAQYKLEFNVWDKKTKNFFIGFMTFIAIIFIFNSIIQQSVYWIIDALDFIPAKAGLFWSLMTACSLYSSLTINSQPNKPLYPLQKIS